jgi:hypothetical protein
VCSEKDHEKAILADYFYTLCKERYDDYYANMSPRPAEREFETLVFNLKNALDVNGQPLISDADVKVVQLLVDRFNQSKEKLEAFVKLANAYSVLEHKRNRFINKPVSFDGWVEKNSIKIALEWTIVYFRHLGKAVLDFDDPVLKSLWTSTFPPLSAEEESELESEWKYVDVVPLGQCLWCGATKTNEGNALKWRLSQANYCLGGSCKTAWDRFMVKMRARIDYYSKRKKTVSAEDRLQTKKAAIKLIEQSCFEWNLKKENPVQTLAGLVSDAKDVQRMKMIQHLF